ncbi:MAG: protein-L-isoaspartate O-methyltransferase [Alphaproteobacteria bacterium]|nr:protein-L-isoaspartate O-methyltransferase [Alphaproteobacteria bacterium]
MIDYQSARLNMVESQIRPNKVTDPALLAAFLAVPRESFVPEHLRGIAYIDEDIPLGAGRFMIEPMVLGRLLQLAAIGPEDVVLDVGCGTGYASAVMSRLARRVVALEEDRRLAAAAADGLRRLGASNVAVVEGPLGAGYPERAPYHVILFGGAVAAVPPVIAAQLAEGGRMLAVLKENSGLGKAVLVTRTEGAIGQRVVFDAGTPLLPAFAAEPGFVF